MQRCSQSNLLSQPTEFVAAVDISDSITEEHSGNFREKTVSNQLTIYVYVFWFSIGTGQVVFYRASWRPPPPVINKKQLRSQRQFICKNDVQEKSLNIEIFLKT